MLEFTVVVQLLNRVWHFCNLDCSQALCPWNFPGKNTGVGCYFLLQGIFPTQRLNLSLLHWQVDFFYHWATRETLGYIACVCAQSCLTICDIMGCNPPGPYVHGIFLERTLDWVAISSSRGSSPSRDQTQVSCVFCIGRWILYYWHPLGSQEFIGGFKYLLSHFSHVRLCATP